jgi:hypothetical protein
MDFVALDFCSLLLIKLAFKELNLDEREEKIGLVQLFIFTWENPGIRLDT